MNAAKLLNEIVLPNLLEHEGFKAGTRACSLANTRFAELQSHRIEICPNGKPLTVGSLSEASNNVLANTCLLRMKVTLKDAVEAHATLKRLSR